MAQALSSQIFVDTVGSCDWVLYFMGLEVSESSIRPWLFLGSFQEFPRKIPGQSRENFGNPKRRERNMKKEMVPDRFAKQSSQIL